MLKVAICDDNQHCLELVQSRFEKYCEEKNIKVIIECFNDSSLLEEHLEEKNVHDAYILDIEMPNVSGLELSRRIREHSETAYVIFLTAHESYAVKGYGLNVLDYVLKERLDEELNNAFDQLFDRLQRLSDEKIYLINNQRKYIKIQQRDIIYVYKKQKNAVFVLKGHREEWERTTLQEVFKKLDNPDMFFLDRGIIVNVEHIRKIIDDCVETIEGHKIATSKMRIMELKLFLT